MSKTTEDQVRKFSTRDAIYTSIIMDAIDKYKLGIDQVDIAEFVRGKIDEIKVTKKHEIVYWVLRQARAYLRYEKERQRLMDACQDLSDNCLNSLRLVEEGSRSDLNLVFEVTMAVKLEKISDVVRRVASLDGVTIKTVEPCKVINKKSPRKGGSPNLSTTRNNGLL
jgi:hypothetical protein